MICQSKEAQTNTEHYQMPNLVDVDHGIKTNKWKQIKRKPKQTNITPRELEKIDENKYSPLQDSTF